MTTTDPRPTHLLGVVGKAIARETNIQPSPVVIRDGRSGDEVAMLEGTMLATVRRCFRHRPDLTFTVEWNGPAKAVVYANGRGRSEVAARFTLRPITPADIAAVGAPTAIPKELVL